MQFLSTQGYVAPRYADNFIQNPSHAHPHSVYNVE